MKITGVFPISVSLEQLLEYPLSIFGICDRVSNGPPIGEDLMVITTLCSDN